MKKFWDQRYSTQQYVYGLEPNEFLKELLIKIPPGKILLPCEGEGRNAVFAATMGWDVHAFDYSQAGRNKALKLAEQNNVNIKYDIQDALDYTCAIPQYDAIALIFAHFPPEIRNRVHRNIVNCLKPQGMLIMEGFNKSQLGKSSGGPTNIQMLFDIEMLKKDFFDLDIIILEESERILNEGPYHEGNASLIQLIALKK